MAPEALTAWIKAEVKPPSIGPPGLGSAIRFDTRITLTVGLQCLDEQPFSGTQVPNTQPRISRLRRIKVSHRDTLQSGLIGPRSSSYRRTHSRFIAGFVPCRTLRHRRGECVAERP